MMPRWAIRGGGQQSGDVPIAVRSGHQRGGRVRSLNNGGEDLVLELAEPAGAAALLHSTTTAWRVGHDAGWRRPSLK
jgi:hypothetical protein